MTNVNNKKIKIFSSYAHEDEDMRIEMDKYLKVLKRSGKIDTWNDRALLAGQEWDNKIMTELKEADIVLLLISVDFNASDFIWEKELAEAMRRHEAGEAYVVPIILRNCQWRSMPYSKLQALPKNARPVSSYHSKDDAYTEIAKNIELLVDHIISKEIKS
jgi:hypothetical protein